jgi:hypothetical protein
MTKDLAHQPIHPSENEGPPESGEREAKPAKASERDSSGLASKIAAFYSGQDRPAVRGSYNH